jgi:putative ABC transport system permease protein
MTGVGCIGWSGLPASGALTLQIPRYTGKPKADGSAYLDYENPYQTVMRIKGWASFVEGGGATLKVVTDPVIFVATSTLSSLAEAAGYPEEATHWGISVIIKDMSELENVAALLRREFADFTSVLEAAAVSKGSISTAVPMDLRRVTEAIAFVTAALLSATNLMVLMLSRKNEIGILRALGATRWNIAWMVLTESVWIALLGSIAGSVFTQPAIRWQLISNRAASDAIVREVGHGMSKAVAFSTAAAAVFGFLPVARVSV